MSDTTSQIDNVLDYLAVSDNGISPLEAFGLFRTTRLARIIGVLRNRGYVIQTRMHRDVTGKTYARYYFNGWSNRPKDYHASYLKDRHIQAVE